MDQMLRFVDAPQEEHEAPKLFRVRGMIPVHIQFLNIKFVGVDTHYWGGHTIACPGEETCKACKDGLVAVWGGFIFGESWGGGKVTLVALTPVMAATITMNVNDAQGLLGMKVTFRRKTKAANSGVHTTFHGKASQVNEQTMERLIMRTRIIFKDYVIEDQGPPNGPSSPRLN